MHRSFCSEKSSWEYASSCNANIEGWRSYSLNILQLLLFCECAKDFVVISVSKIVSACLDLSSILHKELICFFHEFLAWSFSSSLFQYIDVVNSFEILMKIICDLNAVCCKLDSNANIKCFHSLDISVILFISTMLILLLPSRVIRGTSL